MVQEKKKDKPSTRYLVKVNLSSARRQSGSGNAQKEYYFEVGKKRKQRSPTNGYFKFNFESMAEDLKEPLNLYTEFIVGEEGQEVEILMDFKEKNSNPFKVDDVNSSTKLNLKIGEKRRAYTINEDNLEIRIYLSITKVQL